MRRLLQRLLSNQVIKLANKLSSKPDKTRVDAALRNLYNNIKANPGKKGLVIQFDTSHDKFIIFSDQHKGGKDGMDVFALAEKNYLAALNYYQQQNFFYINLGDSEEFWENRVTTIRRNNKATFEQEKKLLNNNAFVKIFGNHDLFWDNDPLAQLNLQLVYGQKISIYEGVILKTTIDNKPLEIYMTHGHQGDMQSDGNWFSKWFVSTIWAPFQSYLRINPNTPANNDQLKTDHNRIMYQWSSERKNLLLITGHTHQPVFKSMTELEILYQKLETEKRLNNEAVIKDLQRQIVKRHAKGDVIPDFAGYLDTYFNSGCCCFDDGDITGIELENGYIRLIKWQYNQQKNSERLVLEECKMEDLNLKWE